MVTIVRDWFCMRERYYYDHRLKAVDGWCQCDTTQDAWYFGIWTNPMLRKTITFCEGDYTEEKCSTDAEYVDCVREAARSYRESGYGFVIDDMTNETVRARFAELGLEDLLYTLEATK